MEKTGAHLHEKAEQGKEILPLQNCLGDRICNDICKGEDLENGTGVQL